MLNECDRVAVQKKIYRTRAALQAGLNGWVEAYNHSRHISLVGVKASLDAAVPGQRGVGEGEGENLSGEPWCGLAVCQMNS